MKPRREDLLSQLPPEWPHDLLPEIACRVGQSGQAIVALDDDPTGTQTVQQVPVLTEWSLAALRAALAEPGALFYILTNTRSLPPGEAADLNRQVARNLKAASQATGRPFVIISRSDSTLRGHYPVEIEALEAALGGRFDGTLLIPFFGEGGRLTINDIHYVAEGEWLTPVAETEFARDAAFGYRHSNLRAWVVEKTGGRLPPEQVVSLSLQELRLGGPTSVANRLAQARGGQVFLVNAAGYRDLEVFVAGLLQAEAAGKRFLYRSAASFVRVRAGLAPQPLLRRAELLAQLPAPGGSHQPDSGTAGGLVVVGSHIQKSTAQLEALLALPRVTGVEAAVPRLLSPGESQAEVTRAAAAVSAALRAGQEAVLFTSRFLPATPGAAAALQVGREVSGALVQIVRRLHLRPAWVIAKGGITCADLATGALGVQQALVLGQALPGVPVWRTGAGSRWPGIIYVVFPGNVGQPDSLAEMVSLLRGGQ
jgi:uncharacterized protein YgbK (DUF1537 family)